MTKETEETKERTLGTLIIVRDGKAELVDQMEYTLDALENYKKYGFATYHDMLLFLI